MKNVERYNEGYHAGFKEGEKEAKIRNECFGAIARIVGINEAKFLPPGKYSSKDPFVAGYDAGYKQGYMLNRTIKRQKWSILKHLIRKFRSKF